MPHPAQAVTLLGLDTVKILGLSVQVFSQFDQSRLANLGLSAFWDHSVAVATCAQQIAIAEGCDQKTIDYAFTAGLLHDVGKLVLAVHAPAQYDQALAQAAAGEIGLIEAERAVFKAITHVKWAPIYWGFGGCRDLLWRPCHFTIAPVVIRVKHLM